ncbi:hypothetical protein I6F65_09545 [Pseudoalteromonas sp. SWXJZ94C]|uniref:Ig-like domain-containing protein n=1 Tax=Pseudoalteromonas sp. SWXJZ94C TaxID=2792065 RepID=UPI0018CDDAB5|nr:Ig-like domain-containing protein [Pseudoalteromonas sp. SWXJZ94C]MBH0057207.1 hypothetical protein [Pseudoalteromonas sp. SWXJZ94C]
MKYKLLKTTLLLTCMTTAIASNYALASEPAKSSNDTYIAKFFDHTLSVATGLEGAYTGDFNGDGIKEIVTVQNSTIDFINSIENNEFKVTDKIVVSNRQYYERNPLSKTYRNAEYYHGGLFRSSFYFYDVNSDSHYLYIEAEKEVPTSNYNTAMYIVDLATRKIKNTVEINILDYTLPRVLDFNNDGVNELIKYGVVNRQYNTVNILDPLTLEIINTYPFPETEVENLKYIKKVGSFTEKNEQQILFINGQISQLQNTGMDLITKTNIPASLDLLITDTNNDGYDEVILLNKNSISIYNPRTNTIDLTTENLEGSYLHKTIVDYNGDGINDSMFYFDPDRQIVFGLSLLNLEVFWEYEVIDFQCSASFLIDDVNGDGNLNLACGSRPFLDGAYRAENSSTKYKIIDIPSKETLWNKETLVYSSGIYEVVDINSDEKPELIYSEDSYSTLKVIDLETKRPFYTEVENILSVSNPNSPNLLAQKVTTGDLFNTGKKQIIIGTKDIDNLALQVLSPENAELMYQVELEGKEITQLKTLDINNDGVLEILLIVNIADNNHILYVLNGQTGDVIKSATIAHWTLSAYDMESIYLNNSDIPKLVLSEKYHDSSLIIYDFVDNTFTNYAYDSGHHWSYSNYSYATKVKVGNEERLVSVNHSNSTASYLQTNGEVEKIAANLCDSDTDTDPRGTAIYYIGGVAKSEKNWRVIYSCGKDLRELNLNSGENTTILNNNIFSDKLKTTTIGDTTYISAIGSSAVIYAKKVDQKSEKPNDASFSTHALSPIEIDLQLNNIDNIIIDTPKLGTIEYIDNKVGIFTYTPKGEVGVENLYFYTVLDGLESEVANIDIEIKNTKPTTNDFTVSTHWNTPIEFSLQGNDDDQDLLTYNFNTLPASGTIELIDQNNGNVRYIPNAQSLEPLTATYTASDSITNSEQSIVTIMFTNTKPVAKNANYNVVGSDPINAQLSGTDEDGDPITFKLISQPAYGSVSIESETGLFVYTPEGESNQATSFKYSVSDKLSESEIKTVSIVLSADEVDENVDDNTDNENVDGSTDDEKSSGSMFYLLLIAMITLSRRYKL